MAENLNDYGVRYSDTKDLCLGEMEVDEELCESLTPELSVLSESLDPQLSVPSQSINPQLSVPSQPINPQLSVPSQSINPQLSVPSESINSQLSVPSESINPQLSVPSESINSQLSVPSESINSQLSVPSESIIPERGRYLCLVKKHGGLYGGYKKELITENMTERELTTYICPSCKGIVRDPCTSSSGKPICYCCVFTTLGVVKSPPLSSDSIGKTGKPNEYIRVMVIALKCSCPLIYRGCKWVGTLGTCEDHLDVCGYVREKCKLNCQVVLSRDELKVHEKDTCINRMLVCEYCGCNYIAHEYPKHLDVCPKMKVTCELRCGIAICRENITQHVANECPEKEVECPFVKYKCVGIIKRRGLNQHLEENRTQHLEMKLNAMEDIIMKQSEFIDIQNEKFETQKRDILEKQSEIINTEIMKHVIFLCSITNTTKFVWKIENVANFMEYCILSSEPYTVAEYKFKFQISNRTIGIHFPETTSKHLKPFRAKFNIFLVSSEDTNVTKLITRSTVEIKQKYLNSGCWKKIDRIFEEDIDKFSREGSTMGTVGALILKIFITLQ